MAGSLAAHSSSVTSTSAPLVSVAGLSKPGHGIPNSCIGALEMANHEGIFSLKDLKEAYQTFQDIKARDPSDPSLPFYKAFSSQLAGRNDVARKHYQTFREACIGAYGDIPSAVARYQKSLESLEAKGLDEKNKEVIFLKMMISKLEAPTAEKTYDTSAVEARPSCTLQ